MDGRAHISVSVTGIAGPTGGTPDKPVGLVYFGLGVLDNETVTTSSQKKIFADMSRDEVREHTVITALEVFRSALKT